MQAHARAGYLVTTSTIGEVVHAFVPHPLPPEPPVALTPEDHALMEASLLALGRLDGLGLMLPDTSLFIYMYVRKEAVLSSQIEGTQSSLSDLLLYESADAPGAPLDDVVEVSNYVAAIEHGVERMQGGFPLSLRLIREMHERLLARGRGANKQPGEFRTSQNWIGGARPGVARFVPPPPEQLMTCLGALELFMHGQPVRTPVLLRAAMAHVQFETIHPFLDGNGRLGRLLIPLIFCAEGVLQEPTLYLSLYFKQNREEYYALLQGVRERGEWEEWVRFFLQGVRETAENATRMARAVITRFEADRAQLSKLGRNANAALRIHEAMQRSPISPIAHLAEQASLSLNAAIRAIGHLEQAGLVREITGRQRGRIFVYQAYLDLLNEGTTTPPGL